MKYVTHGGAYRFEILPLTDTYVDIEIYDNEGGRDSYWHSTVAGAKAFIKREYDGIALDRWQRVEED